MIAVYMNNQYLKTSVMENNKQTNFQNADKMADDPCGLSETARVFLSESNIPRRSVIITLENKFEYNQIVELLDSIMYQKKLMDSYGLDGINNKWDLDKFPVTKTDTQMNGIQRDIQTYNETVKQYNEYCIHLGLEYGIDIANEMKKGCKILFRPPVTS